jgi:hypothetical protein
MSVPLSDLEVSALTSDAKRKVIFAEGAILEKNPIKCGYRGKNPHICLEGLAIVEKIERDCVSGR